MTQQLSLKKALANILCFEPIGSVKMYAGSSAPSKWLFCRGQAVSRTTYARLFAIIGTTYGAGDGSTTFNVPDFRDRMPIGAGNLYALNASGGNKDAIIPYHRHSVSKFNTGGMSANETHTHKDGVNDAGIFGVVAGTSTCQVRADAASGRNTTSANLAHTHEVGAHNTNYVGTSGNTTNANLPPYRAINYIIFAGK